MLSVVSRWRRAPEPPATRVALPSAGGGLLLADERGTVWLLDDDGRPLGNHRPADSLRAIAVCAAGGGGFVLSAIDLARLGPEGTAMWREPSPAWPLDLAASRDGKQIAVSARDGVVALFSWSGKVLFRGSVPHNADHAVPACGRSALVVVGARGEVTCLPAVPPERSGAAAGWRIRLGCTASRPDVAGDQVVVPSFDGIHRFSIGGEPSGLIDLGRPCLRACLTGDGDRLLALDTAPRLALLETATGRTLWTHPLDAVPRDLSLAPDGRGFVVVDAAGGIERYDVREVAARAAGPDARFVEIGSGSGPEPRLRWRARVAAIDAAELAFGSGGESVALLDRARGELSWWRGPDGPAWSDVRVGVGARLASATRGDLLLTWGAGGTTVHSSARPRIAHVDGDARAVAVADDGASASIAGPLELRWIDPAGRAISGPAARALTMRLRGSAVASVSLAPEGDRIAAAGFDGRLHVVDRDGAGISAELGAEALAAWFGDRTIAATRDGRVVAVDRAGRIDCELAIPSRSAATEVWRIGPDLLVADAAGRIHRLGRDPWSLAALPPGPAGGRAFAVSMDRLREFRYDSSQIACVDALSGAVRWKRAVDEAPQCFAVTPDGRSLAALVSGELVVYDLISGDAAPPRFLEL